MSGLHGLRRGVPSMDVCCAYDHLDRVLPKSICRWQVKLSEKRESSLAVKDIRSGF